jgi:hypothetical protein
VAAKRLKIRAVVDRARARKWHQFAVNGLRALGHEVRIVLDADTRRMPTIITALQSLERLVYGGRDLAYGGSWSDPSADEPVNFTPDLILDFTCFERSAHPVRTLRPLFAGSLMEEAAHLALLNGVAPVLGVLDSGPPIAAVELHVATEDPFKTNRAMDFLGARLCAFFVKTVSDIAAGLQPRRDASVNNGTLTLTSWSHGQTLSALTSRAQAAIKRLTSRAPRWHVGWRRVAGGGIADCLEIPDSGWRRLPDDGQRYYADPFPVHRNGRDWLLVEEFPYATQKGVLSAVEIGPDGPAGSPRPFMELGHHLSYPFTFEDGGQLWMIPEGCASRRVELYRSVEFPWTWELVRVLIADEDVSDPTVVKFNGRYWLFGTVSGAWQSGWDTLKIWSAETLEGPWSPCGDGAALIDSRSARPAGRFFLKDGDLWRPAQDCSTGYGAGLVFARVDQLETNGFSQTIRAVLRPNQAWPGVGIHTFNLENGLEAVDGCSA